MAFITDPWSSNTGGVEVAATVNITFYATQNQSSGIRCPAQGAFTLKPWAAATLALTTLIVTAVGRRKITQ